MSLGAVSVPSSVTSPEEYCAVKPSIRLFGKGCAPESRNITEYSLVSVKKIIDESSGSLCYVKRYISRRTLRREAEH